MAAPSTIRTRPAPSTGGTSSIVGGLVGANVLVLNVPAQFTIPGSSFPNGTVVDSFASGAVSGGNFSVVGGLIGQNGGSINGLTANNNVSGGDGSTVGGLVGINGGPGALPGLPGVFFTCATTTCLALHNMTASTAPGQIA